MANEMQRGNLTGTAIMRMPISGTVSIGGKQMKELRFMPYSEFPEEGREDVLYIDTDGNAMYYWDGTEYIALSGGGSGGTGDYNELSNKPQINGNVLTGNKTAANLGLQETISDIDTIRSGAASGSTAVQPETLATALSTKQDVISDLSTIRSGAALGTTAVQPETLETALSDKQDVINDLDDIRAGAELGATAVQHSDMEAALSDKQDVISDLSAIRSGAAAGATAVQPSDMEIALSGKQDTISDLQTIRSGAALGATAVQPSDMEAALADKQDTISDLQTIRSGAASGATAVQPADMETALADKQDVISDLDAIRSGATEGNTALQPEDIDTLPTDGSSNPVSSGGTYNFVNSSIATNTAYFIGTFSSVADLEAYTGTVTNNDYAFVTSTDSAGNTLYNRYKYNAATQEWSFEYAVNNTAFTAAQWAAIQSGMTSADKTKLDGIEQGANKTVIDASPTSGSSNAVSSGGVYTALSGKQDTISDLSDIRAGATSGATAVQPSALNDYQTKLSGTNKLDPAYIEYDVSHRAVSDTEKSTWNSKQDAISDLSTIRSGAAAGATALQQSDVTSTYSASGTAPVNGTAVSDALGTLNVSSVGGTGKVISAISETDGKISATETTMDTTPTANSTVPVTSGGVATDQTRQEVEIGAVANAGAKNLLDVQNPTTTTRTSYTPLANGGVELSCSNAAWTSYAIADIPVEAGKEYIITFLLDESSGTSKFSFFLRDGNSSGINIATKNYGSTIGKYEASVTPNNSTIWLGIYLNNSATAATATAKLRCMIRPASIIDSTFQPYAPTNRELYEMIRALQNA